MRHLAPALALIAFAAPSTAQTAAGLPADAARSTIESFAREFDVDGDGRIARAELAGGVRTVFPSVDADGSGAVDRREFLEWEFGFADMARFRSREQAYEAAMGLVFELYDRDGSGAVDEGEYATAMDASLDYADVDEDGALTYDEFFRGFLINVALRNAMVER